MPKDRNSMGAVTRRGPNAGGRSAAFSRWRRERPFWGSALAIIAGLEIYSAAAAPISVMAMQGLPGLLTICVALVAVIMGAVTLFQPVQRVITGWIVLVLGPISILATNLGGFVVGMIMLVVGGALILSWQPLGAADAGPAVTSPLVADPYTPPEARDEYADDVADDAYAGTAHSETVAAEPVGETATRNPWRNDPTSPLSGLGTASASASASASSEPVHAEPARTESARTESAQAEPTYAEPTYAEPVSAGPVKPEPGYGTAPEPDEPEQTRNPWRSRTPSAIREEAPEPVPATPEPAWEPAPEPAPAPMSGSTPDDAPGETTPNRSEPNASAALSPAMATDAGRSADAVAGTRSWFGNGSGGGQLSPMEPPKSFVRTTLLVPLILVSIAASGLLAAPSAQAQTAALPCLISVLCPAPSPTPTTEPTAEPSAAPSATPSSGVTLPTLPSLTDLLPGDTKDTGDAAKTPDLAGAADCPTAAKAPEGTTSGGQAAIDGAAAIQACQKAGDTAKISAAAVGGDPQNASGLLSTMKASRLEMSGFAYNGVKTLSTAKGPVRALSFSVDELKVTDYDHIYPNDFGETALKDGPLTTLTGNVRLYVTSMTGNIYGLIPLTFTPDFAPPLVLPSMFFTDTTSKVVFVSADTITLPKFGLKMQ